MLSYRLLVSALLLCATTAASAAIVSPPQPSAAEVTDTTSVVAPAADGTSVDATAVDATSVDAAAADAAPAPAGLADGDIPGLAPGRLPTWRDPSAADPAPRHPELRPVLDAFGGEPGLVALTATFVARLRVDPRTAPYFVDADHARLERQLADQFCVILGGDCEYTGADMKSSHEGLAIDRAAFNALVEVLQQSMDEHDIPFRAQNRLLAKLAPMHREVVTE